MRQQPPFYKNKSKNFSKKEEETEQQLFGFHAVRAALLNKNRTCFRLCLTQNAFNELQDTLSAGNYPEPEILSRQKIDKLVHGDTVHQGCVAWFSLPESGDLEDFLFNAPEKCRFVILDHVTDPHNVGAIMRSMAAFGAQALIMHHRHSAPLTGTLAKTAVGALEYVPVFYVRNLAATMETLKEHRFQCLGLDERGDKLSQDKDWGERTAVVFGAEGKGLREKTKETCDHLVAIPTTDTLTSLNVSVAAAITLFCLYKQ